MWTNYHTHSTYSDGKAKLKKYINQAINQKMYALGMSEHAPLPFEAEWCMQIAKLPDYLAEMQELKMKYQKQIKLFTGLEIDYIRDISDVDMYTKCGLDYTIGGIHFLKKNIDQNDYKDFDDSPQQFQYIFEKQFDNEPEKIVAYYYDQVMEMVINHPPDVIAHLDLITKFNTKNGKYVFFDEDANWYHNIVKKTLEVISQTNCIVEVNTRGYFKKLCNEFYPKNWIIKLCNEMNIPITINSDSHHPSELDTFHPKVAQFLQQIGVNEIQIFDENGWHGIPFTADGITI